MNLLASIVQSAIIHRADSPTLDGSKRNGTIPASRSDDTKSDALVVTEWKECRFTVDRFDKILADLRKYSFTIITGFVTAGTFLNLIGIRPGNTDAAVPHLAPAVVTAIISLLVVALFALDCHYSVLLTRAIGRAIVVEQMTRPPLGLTGAISGIALCWKVARVVVALYVAELICLFALVVSVYERGSAGFLVGAATTGGGAFFVLWYFWLIRRDLDPAGRRVKASPTAAHSVPTGHT